MIKICAASQKVQKFWYTETFFPRCKFRDDTSKISTISISSFKSSFFSVSLHVILGTAVILGEAFGLSQEFQSPSIPVEVQIKR